MSYLMWIWSCRWQVLDDGSSARVTDIICREHICYAGYFVWWVCSRLLSLPDLSVSTEHLTGIPSLSARWSLLTVYHNCQGTDALQNNLPPTKYLCIYWTEKVSKGGQDQTLPSPFTQMENMPLCWIFTRSWVSRCDSQARSRSCGEFLKWFPPRPGAFLCTVNPLSSPPLSPPPQLQRTY